MPFFDVTSTFFGPADLPSSGSFEGVGDSQNVFEIRDFTALDAEVFGAWSGAGFNYGALVVLTGTESSFQLGNWYGADNNWGANGASLENHVKDQVTSDSNPNGNEGINMGDYNPFPIPEPPLDPPEKIRDATRFRKGYSFARNQPVRIRVFRR